MIDHHYTVCTPKYTSYYSYDAMEPPETGADCVTVIAETKRLAKVQAVKELRKIRSEWMQDQASDNASPFTGLEVFENVCPHGICHCDICDKHPFWKMCQVCYDEAIEDEDDH